MEIKLLESMDMGFGWLPPEYDGQRVFRWTGALSEVFVEPADNNYLVFHAGTDRNGRAMQVISDGAVIREFKMEFGWWYYTVRIPSTDRLFLHSETFCQGGGDRRALGIMVAELFVTQQIQPGDLRIDEHYLATKPDFNV